MPDPAAHPAAYLNVEEYQIAFLCDNFFLLARTSDLHLHVPPRIKNAERDETPVSVEN
jgi:hypothetical protein